VFSIVVEQPPIEIPTDISALQQHWWQHAIGAIGCPDRPLVHLKPHPKHGLTCGVAVMNIIAVIIVAGIVGRALHECDHRQTK
jgi:hypothetical protein